MGKAFKCGSDIDTDLIIPGQYLSLENDAALAMHCMEGWREGFAQEVKEGDIIVAGNNFGCGSSREHAPRSILASGVACIIAESFARIFFRNAINIGLPVIESKEAVAGIKENDEVEVLVTEGGIRNLTTGKSFEFVPYPEYISRIISAGGIKKLMQGECRNSRIK